MFSSPVYLSTTILALIALLASIVFQLLEMRAYLMLLF